MAGSSSLAGFSALLLAVACATGEEVMPEIVVEAWRGAVLPPHFAGNATVIGEEEIISSGVRSVAELLAVKGGVRLTSASGNAAAGAVHLRGFGENSSSRVLVMVDGRPVNRPDMAAVSLLEVPISRIVRVEILRGAQTARFGDNAAAGVINLVTREPSGKGSGYLEAAGGSDGLAIYRLGYGGRFGADGLRVDLERNFSDGWRQNAMSEVESANLRWNRRMGGGWDVDAGVGWSDELTGFPGPLTEVRYKDDPRQSIYVQAGQEDQYFSEQEQWKADVDLAWKGREGMGVGLPLAWSRRDQAWNFGPGSHTDNLLDSVTFRPGWSWQSDALDVRAGLNFRYDSLDLTQFREIQRRNKTAVADLERMVYGASAAVDWEAVRGWHLGFAARLEGSRVDARAESIRFPWDPDLNFDRGGSELNHALQLGLRWEGDAADAWLRYDHLYRLPSTDEIASYQGFPMAEPFNDRLEAETGHQTELGGEWRKDGWRFRLNGFVQWLDGEIAYDYLRNLNVNLAETRRYGVETELGWNSARWDLLFRHTWLDARQQSGQYSGKEIYLVPRHEFSAVAGWRPLDQWLVQAEYQYTGSSFEGNDLANNRPKLPSHATANLMLRWESKDGWSVYGRVNNLTDERYATVKYNGVWYPAAGRQYQIGIRKEF